MLKTTVYSAIIPLFDFRVLGILDSQENGICVECCLASHLEDLDFLDLEILRTREDDPSVHSGIVGRREAKGSAIVGVCASPALVTKAWTLFVHRF
jgi:hypothetical protein